MITRTEIHLPKFPYDIDHGSKVFLIGSCFSDNIGQKLKEHRFDTLANPFGVVYNPVSILRQFQHTIASDIIDQNLTLSRADKVYHFDYHSSINGKDIQAINTLFSNTHRLCFDYLSSCTHVIITLGTAWVYALKENRQVVANCHKQPQSQFNKRLLSQVEVEKALSDLIKLIKSQNSTAKIIFTVSPVRHIKDGIPENQLSKAILITSIHKVCTDDSAFYLPIYEIMMDDLRDYRYYANDMLHPSDVAIDYIWHKFIEAFCDQTTLDKIHLASKINKMNAHRPFDEKGTDYQSHLNKIKNLEQQWLNLKS
jgi:hypothetical protein